MSLVDYPGQASAVLFLQGCNLCCPFCHNADLIPLQSPKESSFTWSQVQKKMLERQTLVKAITITGGEPCLHSQLEDLLHQCREMGFQIKLDTNGTFPSRLKKILTQKLVDFVAMDIKAPLNHEMKIATGRSLQEKKIQKSLDLLQHSNLPYELRTTCHSNIDSSSLKSIAEQIPAQATWILQHCRSIETYEAKPRTTTWAQEQKDKLQQMIPHLFLRGWP